MRHVQRLWTVSVLIVTVGMLATVVYVITRHDIVPQAGQTPGYIATPTFISLILAFLHEQTRSN